MTEARTVVLENSRGTASVYLDPFSTRIRLDEYSGAPATVLGLVDEAIHPWVEKIILKSKAADREAFIAAGYREEAMVRGYFHGADMHFMVRYTDPTREEPVDSRAEEDRIRDLVMRSVTPREPDPRLAVPAGFSDAEELSAIFRQVFQVYPTPVEDPSYLRKTMYEGTMYYAIHQEGRMVSVGSAEVNEKWSNAELTDCATLTEVAGKGYMFSIMARIDQELIRRGIRSRYSIARAMSYPVNVIFHRLGYVYAGCLRKNVRIGTGLEDMNVWCRFNP